MIPAAAAPAAATPMGPAIALGLGAAFMGASLIGQHNSARKIAKAYNRMADATIQQTQFAQRLADIENVRKQRDMIRKARIASANIVNAGANTNTQNSSGVAGGVSSVTSQMAGELDYFREAGGVQSQILQSQATVAKWQGKLGGYQANAQMWGALGNIGGQIFEAGGGWKSIFSS